MSVAANLQTVPDIAESEKTRLVAVLRHGLFPVIANTYRLWVPANVLMLTVTQGRLQHRVAIIALVSLMWKPYVTMVEHVPIRQDEQNSHQAQDGKKECSL